MLDLAEIRRLVVQITAIEKDDLVGGREPGDRLRSDSAGRSRCAARARCVFKFVWQKSTPPQIRQLILYYH